MLGSHLFFISAILFFLVSPASAAAPPANLAELECAFASLAANVAVARLGTPGVAPALRDALNIDFLCNSSVPAPPPPAASLFAAAARAAAARSAALAPRGAPTAAAFYVAAAGGSDSNAGTRAAPFATLARAAAAARAAGPGSTVFLRAGTFWLGDGAAQAGGGPLVLGAADSGVTWRSDPADAPARARLSGATRLSSLAWANASAALRLPPGVLVAPVAIPDARAAAWRAAHGGGSNGSVGGRRGRAGPPPLVASLFVDGARQVRARYPNAPGGPEVSSGLCFSATQRPGEGCAAWSSCALRATGTQPAPPGVLVSGVGPNRGDSPTLGCPQCGHGGSFAYTIYPPPDGHPVYNKPLPGVGWGNTSVFSFWASPFSRPAGVVVDASARCDAHWAAVNYSNPTGAVVHMFHSGLWGGWMFAVDSVDTAVATNGAAAAATTNDAAAAAAAAMPDDMILQLKADALLGTLADGAAVSAWPNSAPRAAGAHGAAQALAAKQPVFRAASWPGALPQVSFAGAQALSEASLPLPAQSTLFAAVRDTGSRTDYCSGVFYSAGADKSVCTRAATAGAPGADDDPPPAGAAIIATALDWGGSPADPGHRDLRGKAAVLTVVYADDATTVAVDGCAELAAGPQGATGAGYSVGTRNDELGRYLVGDVAEVIVYARALNASEVAAVEAYLRAKWGVAQPKHCAPPPPPGGLLSINFGYGGYQEARGSGVNAGQRFYIENVLEELDTPGEWFYDAGAGQLFLFPNVSMAALAAADVAVPVLDAVVVINGTAGGPFATDIALLDVEVTHSRVTFLEQYEVPSGGDWSVHRGAAVVVQDAERVAIAGATFTATGGNAVLFSNHVKDSNITDCEFARTGDSAVVFLGGTNGVDGSAPTYPDRNLIARNHMHDVGVYGKQTSCVGLQLAANSTIVDNVCYNGPRAGINYNDGFGGGNLFKGNVVFNAVRETGDHGNLNTWDRQPYWTMSGVDDGFNDTRGRSFIRAWDLNTQNMMLNGYNGVWTFDHDDCSQFVKDVGNVMVFGGCKNYVGDTKQCNDNLILYPGMQGRSQGDRRCQTDDNGEFANSYHLNNVCTSADGKFYSNSGCTTTNLATSVYVTANNTLLSDAGTPPFSQTCGAALTFAQWQALGQDAGSVVGVTPDVPTLISLATAKLGL
jgi:hypothetical protein